MALSQILELTQRMQKNADEELWEELIELEQQRQLMIDTTFPIDNPQQNDRLLLEQIIDLNQKLEQQCNKAKVEVQQQLSSLNSNKKAMAAYLR